MTQALIDHLWQSTLFAALVTALTFAFRRNGAHIRFALWLAASLKFLLPFPLIVAVGRHLRWQSAPTLPAASPYYIAADEFVRPGTILSPVSAAMQNAATHWDWWSAAGAVWILGVVALLGRWAWHWWALHRAIRTATPLDLGTPIPVLETDSTAEPGVFGVVRPVILLPRGILDHLTPDHLQAILVHELCHWRRRDNLAAALHMIVEALFWFHPLVWWLGARLVTERERACDEAVVGSGGDREVYAEGILKVCRFYAEPKLLCVAGVSGGGLRNRIEEIMTMTILAKLSITKKVLLAGMTCLAIAVPLCLGLADGPPVEMRHYKSAEWGFAIDVPRQFNTFPPNPTNSQFEVVRFMSEEDGHHAVIVFRNPHDPKESLAENVAKSQVTLTKAGFSNFATLETSIGSAKVLRLDFDKEREHDHWYVREYFIDDGTLLYVLGFGTSKPEAMFDTYDRMAKSFVLEK